MSDGIASVLESTSKQGRHYNVSATSLVTTT